MQSTEVSPTILLEAFEESKKKFLAELDGWSIAQLKFSPPETWNALQVLEHILASETGTLGYMKKKTSSGWHDLPLVGEEQVKSSQALNSRLQSTERYKAPAILQEPEGKASLEQLKEQWSDLRRDFHAFVMDLDKNFYDKLIFRQPLAGPLTLAQTLEFLTHHIEHHIPQIQRIKLSFTH